MKKTLLLIFITIAWLSGGNLLAIDINPASGPYYVGDNILFKATNTAFDYYYGTLSFGDGTTVSGVTSTQWIAHRYKSPGQYLLTLVDTYGFVGTESRYITITEDRRIEVSPPQPVARQQVTFQAINFNTPDDIHWDMGDGTIYRLKGNASVKGGSVVTHTFTRGGTFTVRAYDWNGDQKTVPVAVSINIGKLNRRIEYFPLTPREDQTVYFEALDFGSQVIDWNFGDGHTEFGGLRTARHRFMHAGTYTVSCKPPAAQYAPITTTITVLPENRFITVNTPEVRINQPVTATVQNFRGDMVLWNFGDGTVKTGFHTETHTYTQPGDYVIIARDENGESEREFRANIRVVGLNDLLTVEVAEIRLDNGKYYKIVPKHSKELRAILRLKMRGTGTVTGYWVVDGSPFEYFNEVAIQGELKEIFTRQVPGLPTIEPGLHTVSLVLTRPSPEELNLTFPVLKYFVLPYENKIEIVSPAEGFIAKENEIPEFSWKAPAGGSKYQITFSNELYPILQNSPNLKWIDLENARNYTPGPDIWKGIARNRWSYWKVRAMDSNYQPLAESDVIDIKVVIATADISIDRITDLDGNQVKITATNAYSSKGDLLLHGSITYKGDSKFLVLRVFAGKEMVDQLLFRDVKKGDTRGFETSIPNKDKSTPITLQVLKTSSPSVIIGIKNLVLKKQ